MAASLPTMVANATVSGLVVGNTSSNFWLFHPQRGFDLTHPSSPEGHTNLRQFQLLTSTAPVTIAPEKTALVVIDMQNYFLSDGMNNPRGPGHDAEELLLSEAFPAARKAGIQIIYVTWGISDEELAVLPPVIFRIFGYDETSESWNSAHEVENGAGKEYPLKITVGDDIGDAKFPDGSRVPAGRLLMRDQWNTALHEPFQKEFEKSQSSPLPDQRFHKARLSGFWGGETAALRFVNEKNITTLMFAGVNIDQCVLASLQDASNMGFDTILLKDGCATDSPDYAIKMTEYNCRKSWGFVTSCKALKDGVESGADAHL